MHTVICKIDPARAKDAAFSEAERDILRAAGEIIRGGGLVAFPTETVYGLGASALDAAAAEKIYRAKGRPSDNPLIVHLSSPDEAEKYAYVNDLYRALARRFMPGPLTLILPKKACIPDSVTGGLSTVALRVPENKIAAALIASAGMPVAAPSANLSGKPSPTRARHVIEDMDGRADMIIDGGDCAIGLESTVALVEENSVKILRPGAVTAEMLSRVAPVTMDKTVLQKPEGDLRPLSPGMKYRHYAPAAPVTMVAGAPEAVLRFFRARLEEDPRTGIIAHGSYKDQIAGKNVFYLPDDRAGEAHELFDVLRRFDGTDARRIYAVTPQKDGVGLAVYNRLIKAAGFHLVNAE